MFNRLEAGHWDRNDSISSSSLNSGAAVVGISKLGISSISPSSCLFTRRRSRRSKTISPVEEYLSKEQKTDEGYTEPEFNLAIVERRKWRRYRRIITREDLIGIRPESSLSLS